ncbi:MAG: glutamate racemase [Ferruginibacter sp.]|nr:glutamate racemase [Ferruginibacter sp.]
MINQPIGVFDSGYGGLSILKEIVQQLPGYDYVYLGDNARAPYGTRSFETVYQYTLQCVKWFFEQGCPLLVIACNTASAKALRTIQQNDLPALGTEKRVLGVIRPTSEIIGHYTKTGHIGIMGTTGTIQSNSYVIEIEKFFPNLVVSQESCPMWVPLVENNEYQSPGADYFVKKHIDQLLKKDAAIDSILLACTHYPLLMDKILQYMPKDISVITQGTIVAKSLEDYLQRHPETAVKCSKNGQRYFFTTGDTADFNNHASLFFGEEVQAEKAMLM